MAETVKQKHFVLVHGGCHGAWCWYKLKPLLEAAGHQVTALDLAASGIDMKPIKDVRTFKEYSEPLLEKMASLSPEEKVILVGHSFGGLSLALAADKFPDKISVAVFLTAFLPDTNHQPCYVLDQWLKRMGNEDQPWMDSEILACDTSNPSEISILLGHNFLASKLYQLCPPEDLELAKALLRPGSMSRFDLPKASKFNNEGYGSVKRAYIVCEYDMCLPKEFQQWMIQNYPVDEVMEIKGADHMAMLSTPQQLSDYLSQIAQKFD